MIKIAVKTSKRQEFIDLTDQISEAISAEHFEDGLICIYVPHTTAAITINENADPDVVDDLLMTFKDHYPVRSDYQHLEGNSDSHAKSSAIGCSLTLIVERGRLQLGTWQSIYFAEFDGPRNRQVWIKLIKGT